MIIVKIKGGLGNQLFQYAAGLALAKRLNTELKLDTSFYLEKQKVKRIFLLNNFFIEADELKKQDLKKINLYFRKILFKWGVSRIGKMTLFLEKDFSFNDDFIKLNKNVYMDGYWQSDLYFKEIANLIRRQIRLKKTPSQSFISISNFIKEKKRSTVSLHIRRGDYVSDTVTNNFHGVLPLIYYEEAVNFIKSRISNPHFFVFSDDIEWCKKNLNLKNNVTFVSNQDKLKDVEELLLMKLCSHNIIANSSFSWWGAWLNDFASKIVISPKKWFANKEMNSKTKDLIPKTWIRV